MRKPAFFMCENKGIDQLRSNCIADQRLCFPYIDSSIPLFLNPKSPAFVAIFCGCTAWFVSDLIGNPEDRFSRVVAHMVLSVIETHQFHLSSGILSSSRFSTRSDTNQAVQPQKMARGLKFQT